MWKQSLFKLFGVKSPEQAFRVKRGLSIMYAVFAWQLSCYCIYKVIMKVSPDVNDRVNKITTQTGNDNVYKIRFSTASSSMTGSGIKNIDPGKMEEKDL